MQAKCIPAALPDPDTQAQLLGWEVEDIQAVIRALVGRGVKFEQWDLPCSKQDEDGVRRSRPREMLLTRGPNMGIRSKPWKGRPELARWVADGANLVTSCRACNEATNQLWCKMPPAAPSTLSQFFDERDRAYREKRELAQTWNKDEQEKYDRWYKKVSS